MIRFDQKAFVPQGWTFEETTLKEYGLVYMPDSCKDKRCYIHVVHHGCNESVVDTANDFGFNEFAATNDVIMLYPYTVCWGYNKTLPRADDQALTMNGMMPGIVMQMVSTLQMPNRGSAFQSADIDFYAEAIAAFF